MKKHVGILLLAIVFVNTQFVYGNAKIVGDAKIVMILAGTLAGQYDCNNFVSTTAKTVAYSSYMQGRYKKAKRPAITPGVVTVAVVDWLGRKACGTETVKAMWQNITESNIAKTLSNSVLPVLPEEMTSDKSKKFMKEGGLAVVAWLAGYIVDSATGSNTKKNNEYSSLF